MLIPPVKPFRGRKRYKAKGAAKAPAALTLVAAEFDGSVSLFLHFDRAVDVSAANAAAMVVRCVDNESMFGGSGPATLVDAVTVRIDCVYVDEYTGDGVLLDAGADNGIVAVSGGAAWVGTEGMNLPFP